MQILILLTYYERATLVKNALRSILAANEYHKSWKLAFIDDGSQIPGKPIVERILKEHLPQISFYNSHMDAEQKYTSGGCFIGKYMNEAIRDSNADIAIMLCDDDELHPYYFWNLNEYFTLNEEVESCYSNVHIFDPLKEKSCNVFNPVNLEPAWKGHEWFGKTINCAYKVDGSQVAWRTRANKVYGAWFKYPITCNHDAFFFTELNGRTGRSPYTGFFSQYKAVFKDQLINRMRRGDTTVLDKQQEVMFA